MARWPARLSAALMCALLVGCLGDDGPRKKPYAIAACVNGVCPELLSDEGQLARPDDGEKNGSETDVDCGGDDAGTARCEDGKACLAGTDCASKVCGDGQCQVPRGDDGQQNGSESDVDCGGPSPGVPRCDAGRACQQHLDCASDACGYDGRCAAVRSCAGHFGGDTCGAGEVGEPGAQHESCCAAAPVSDAPGAALLDKYVVTAGRMRQFIERHEGNLRGFAESLGSDNPDWNPAWNAKLPSNLGEANYLLGPAGQGTRAGCDLREANGRTYWMSDQENADLGDGTHPFDKDTLDQKALNCVDFFMLQALCVWDGGHLATQDEILAAWSGGESRVYPWGGSELDESRVVYKKNYQFPAEYDKGNFIYIAAPGRRPEGNGKFGHADLAGLMMQITSTFEGSNLIWSGNGSWEGHGIIASGGVSAKTPPERAYWAAGGRCAHRAPQP